LQAEAWRGPVPGQRASTYAALPVRDVERQLVIAPAQADRAFALAVRLREQAGKAGIVLGDLALEQMIVLHDRTSGACEQRQRRNRSSCDA
jgi:uncharacterized protein (UPF0303 family)